MPVAGHHPGHNSALVADLVMAPARTAGDAGSIQTGATPLLVRWPWCSGSAHRAVNAKVPDRYRTVTLKALGGDLGSRWSPKPASEVQFLGRPQFDFPSLQSGPARVSGGEPSPGPARSLVETRSPALTVGWSSGEATASLTRTGQIDERREPWSSRDEVRAGRPRIARLQVGGCLVG